MERVGKYLVRSTLKTTPLSDILLAYDPDLEVKVAVKVFKPKADQLDGRGVVNWLGKFIEEAQVLARLDHSHVVGIRELSANESGTPYFVMPFIESSLAEELAATESGGLSRERADTVLVQLLEALSYLHGQGLAHRDVTPGNILLASEDLKVKLADFGLVKAPDGDFARATIQPRNPAFSAPELLDNPAEADARSDVFSAAKVYEALGSGYADERVKAVCLTAMSEDPALRFPDAASFLGAFRAARETDPAPDPQKGDVVPLLPIDELLTLNIKPEPEPEPEPAPEPKPIPTFKVSTQRIDKPKPAPAPQPKPKAEEKSQPQPQPKPKPQPKPRVQINTGKPVVASRPRAAAPVPAAPVPAAPAPAAPAPQPKAQPRKEPKPEPVPTPQKPEAKPEPSKKVKLKRPLPQPAAVGGKAKPARKAAVKAGAVKRTVTKADPTSKQT
ncbi:MAG: protein kinase domain-containing protein [Magnetovibrionaceae bacterium]